MAFAPIFLLDIIFRFGQSYLQEQVRVPDFNGAICKSDEEEFGCVVSIPHVRYLVCVVQRRFHCLALVSFQF